MPDSEYHWSTLSGHRDILILRTQIRNWFSLFPLWELCPVPPEMEVFRHKKRWTTLRSEGSKNKMKYNKENPFGQNLRLVIEIGGTQKKYDSKHFLKFSQKK